jgi:hypothetical protein
MDSEGILARAKQDRMHDDSMSMQAVGRCPATAKSAPHIAL